MDDFYFVGNLSVGFQGFFGMDKGHKRTIEIFDSQLWGLSVLSKALCKVSDFLFNLKVHPRSLWIKRRKFSQKFIKKSSADVVLSKLFIKLEIAIFSSHDKVVLLQILSSAFPVQRIGKNILDNNYIKHCLFYIMLNEKNFRIVYRETCIFFLSRVHICILLHRGF